MYKDILVPIVFDHDPSEQQALAVAHKLAKAGGKVTLLHIVEELPGFITVQLPEEIYKDTIAEAKSKLQALAKTLPIPIDVMVETGACQPQNFTMCGTIEGRLHRHFFAQTGAERLFPRLHGGPGGTPRNLHGACSALMAEPD